METTIMGCIVASILLSTRQQVVHPRLCQDMLLRGKGGKAKDETQSSPRGNTLGIPGTLFRL